MPFIYTILLLRYSAGLTRVGMMKQVMCYWPPRLERWAYLASRLFPAKQNSVF